MAESIWSKNAASKFSIEANRSGQGASYSLRDTVKRRQRTKIEPPRKRAKKTIPGAGVKKNKTQTVEASRPGCSKEPQFNSFVEAKKPEDSHQPQMISTVEAKKPEDSHQPQMISTVRQLTSVTVREHTEVKVITAVEKRNTDEFCRVQRLTSVTVRRHTEVNVITAVEKRNTEEYSRGEANRPGSSNEPQFNSIDYCQYGMHGNLQRQNANYFSAFNRNMVLPAPQSCAMDQVKVNMITSPEEINKREPSRGLSHSYVSIPSSVEVNNPGSSKVPQMNSRAIKPSTPIEEINREGSSAVKETSPVEEINRDGSSAVCFNQHLQRPLERPSDPPLVFGRMMALNSEQLHPIFRSYWDSEDNAFGSLSHSEEHP